MAGLVCPVRPVADTMRVEMIYTYLGQRVENVFHVDMDTGPVSEGDMDAVFGIFDDWFQSDLKATMNNNVTLDKVIVTDLSTLSGASKEYSPSLPAAGTVADGPLPGNVTAAVKWTTAFRGRSYRGRTYHIGLGDGSISGNQLTTGAQSAIGAAYGALLAAIDTFVTPYNLVVVSRQHNKACLTTPARTPIINNSVDINIDSQRRRLAGRGI